MSNASEGPSAAGRVLPWHRRLLKRWRAEPIDRAQLYEWLRAAEHANLIDPDTLAMMEGALSVAEMRVRDIMVPRSDMVVLEEGVDPRDMLPAVIEAGHSRFPLVDPKTDKVLGIVLAKDLLGCLARGDTQVDLRDAMRSPVFVPESKRLNILLREFRMSRNHMAIVVDEYGRTAGLVSIEDVIEQIVGEIDDEHDVGEDNFIRPHGRNRYTIRARTPLVDFNEYFGTAFETREYDTIGGLVLREFGRVPARGEEIDHAGFNFKVLRADQRRIHLLRVVRQSAVDEVVAAQAED